jgi:hypothetical protein
MELNETFIPGEWSDIIDVDDFVNLNKKPFLSCPNFLIKWSPSTFSYSSPIVKRRFYTFQKDSIDDVIPLVMPSKQKKGIKNGLFNLSSPSFIHPDLRIIVLYGAKFLIQEKRWFLKEEEERIQTASWYERRLDMHHEIEAVKSFVSYAKKDMLDLKEPAKNSKDAFEYMKFMIKTLYQENPDTLFSFSKWIPFLDIYLDYDLKNKAITEEEAQEMVAELTLLSYHLGLGPDSIDCSLPTKSTYRFLAAINDLKLDDWVISFYWSDETPDFFCEFLDEWLIKHQNVRFFKVDRKDLSTFRFSSHFKLGEDLIFDHIAFDLRKVESKDSLITDLTTYVELVNLVAFMCNAYHDVPLRHALMRHQTRFRFHFRFYGLNEWIKKWEREVNFTNQFNWSFHIQDEVEKIPLFRQAVPSYSFEETQPSFFYKELKGVPSVEQVKRFFKEGFSEIHFSC